MTGRGPSSSMETSVQSPKAADTEQTVLCGCLDTDPAEKVQTPQHREDGGQLHGVMRLGKTTHRNL